VWIPIQLDEHSPEPLYHQIEVQLRALIVSGQLVEGTLLPSNRELAQLLKCSVITIRRVYQDLEAEGLLRTRQGTGTFVAHVDSDARDRHRLERLEAAFEAAVDTGLQLRGTPEEMENTFRRVLKRKLEEDSGKPGMNGSSGRRTDA